MDKRIKSEDIKAICTGCERLLEHSDIIKDKEGSGSTVEVEECPVCDEKKGFTLEFKI